MLTTTQPPGSEAVVPRIGRSADATDPASGSAPVPCAARPSTGFVHLDGPCRCFFGGPAPEFAPPTDLVGLAHAS